MRRRHLAGIATLLVAGATGPSCQREEPLPEWPQAQAAGILSLVEAARPEGGTAGTFTVSDLSRPPVDGDVGWWPSVAVAGDGTVHLTYTDAYNGALHHAEGKDGAWAISAVDSYGAVGKYTALTLAPDGTPHVLYYNQDNRILRHAFRAGKKAVEPDDRRRPRRAHEAWVYEVVDQGLEVGMAGRLLFGRDGTLHGVFYGPDQRLVHAWRPPPEDGAPGRWQRRIVDEEAAGSHSIVNGLAEGRDGTLHVSYAHWRVASSELRYGRLPPGADAWETGAIGGVTDAGWKSGLVLDGEDRPVVAYLVLKERQIRIARLEADGWRHHRLVGDANTMDFARAPDGRLVLAYEHLPGRGLGGAVVQYLVRDSADGDLGEGWQVKTVPDGAMATYLALAVDSDGAPVMAFYRGDVRGVAVFDTRSAADDGE